MSNEIQSQSDTVLWKPYRPSPEMPWNLKRVVHLHRRAGFAANWSQLQQDLHDGPVASVDRLLNPASSEGRSSSISRAIYEAATRSESAARLKAWWLFQMLTSTDPFTERLTLMWHNHFATSIRKVSDLRVMGQQNQLFRKHARDPFGDFLAAVIKHPAMMIWLDADSNNKGKPNENLARELMELFTLGVGNYSEVDVKEVARALTGWGVKDDQFIHRSSRHDDGEKQVLNVRGAFTGDDVLQILLSQPATADRLAWRICRTFLGENPEPIAVKQLAVGLREHQLDIRWAIETVVRSQLFFSNSQIQTKVLGPVEFIVGALRSLELDQSGPNTMALADWTSRTGQDLFNPPNVGGWKEGRSWLASSMIVARSNYASALVTGNLWNPTREMHLNDLCQRHAGATDLEQGVAWFAQLFWGHSDPSIVAEVVRAVQASQPSNPMSVAVALLLSNPVHYQA